MSRPVKFSDPEEFQRVADEYFAACDAESEPYTVNGLAYALGLCRETLLRYAEKPGFSDTVKGVRTRLEAHWEKRLGGPNAAGTIFWLKNQGWTDKTGVELTGSNGGPVQYQRTERHIVDPQNPDS